MNWRRENKIEFFHEDPNIIEDYPIIESKDLKLKWVKNAREDFEVAQKTPSSIEQSGYNKIEPYFTHLIRCPGIFDMFKYGYIIPLHKDIIIRTYNKREFNWEFPPIADICISPFKVSAQEEKVVKLLAKPPWACEFIIKIETGWNVIAPKGLKFIFLPIAYPDTFEFTSTIGILNPALATQINFQMFWNETEGETLIPAGTPLGHLIPLSEKKYQMVQRTMNQKDKDWIVKVWHSQFSTSFWPYAMRGKIAAMYNKYWKR